jgi:hypothetical protein
VRGLLLMVSLAQVALVAKTLGWPDLAAAARLFSATYPSASEVGAAVAAFVWCLSAGTVLTLGVQAARAADAARRRDLQLPAALAIFVVGLLVLGFGVSRHYGEPPPFSGGSMVEAQQVAR